MQEKEEKGKEKKKKKGWQVKDTWMATILPTLKAHGWSRWSHPTPKP